MDTEIVIGPDPDGNKAWWAKYENGLCFSFPTCDRPGTHWWHANDQTDHRVFYCFQCALRRNEGSDSGTIHALGEVEPDTEGENW